MPGYVCRDEGGATSQDQVGPASQYILELQRMYSNDAINTYDVFQCIQG